jgi:hypothetical protein
MRVFISWSGERSHKVAETLRRWLPCVSHTLQPWLSSSDLAPGSWWTRDLANELEFAARGIICLTKENLHAP